MRLASSYPNTSSEEVPAVTVTDASPSVCCCEYFATPGSGYGCECWRL